METKSRYAVIADLENTKRELIQERDGLNDQLIEKEKVLKGKIRQKSDNVVILDRQIEDVEEQIADFKSSMKERKETIVELIKSVDESLDRFSKLSTK